MKFKLLHKNSGFIFNTTAEFEAYFGDDYAKILAKIPNTTKKDILEYYEYAIFGLCQFYDLDMAVGEYSLNELDETLLENTPCASLASEFYGVMGQMFLGGMIDFGVENGNLREKGTNFETNLSRVNLGMSLYEKWVYFRDNHFFGRQIYVHDFDVDFVDAVWQNPQTWHSDTPWICITPLGQRYYSEVLLPRIYEKYKDIEVEVSENGEILGWFKNGVKM